MYTRIRSVVNSKFWINIKSPKKLHNETTFVTDKELTPVKTTRVVTCRNGDKIERKEAKMESDMSSDSDSVQVFTSTYKFFVKLHVYSHTKCSKF
jgi:hypothetical protein